eukprot:Nitzschia sp. Nitz4//scaffold34_size148208//61958//63495//NITZ4_002977-RA/size148208-augustus-gene-0.72-mRNA-1//-1//CDS//3329548786//5402//frame0
MAPTFRRMTSRAEWEAREESDSDSAVTPGIRYRTLNKSKSRVILPRLIKRNLTFHQSKNNFAVQNLHEKARLSPLLFRDWFHVLLRLPFHISIGSLLAVWTLMIMLWAQVYVWIDTVSKEADCGLGEPGFPIAYPTAFAFSLETCTTVGYGLPGSTNAFFESNCPSVQASIFIQMLWSMMFNAFLFAFFYNWLSKCESRGSQVVFSNKIAIQTDDKTGKVVISLRCYDVDARFPVVEAHVRMYVMDRRMKMHLLRIQEPDDDMGATMHISIPTEIKHHVDTYSPLSPRCMPMIVNSNGLNLREADSNVGNRDGLYCPVCGEAFGSYMRLKRHLRYQRVIEEQSDYPMKDSHREFEMPDIQPLSLQEVKTFMESFMSEIIVVVEGIDPQVSGTFQALQSYKYEDIAWEGEFEPCIFVENNDFCVDLSKFHQMRMPLSPPPSEMEELSEERSVDFSDTDESAAAEHSPEVPIANGDHHTSKSTVDA